MHVNSYLWRGSSPEYLLTFCVFWGQKYSGLICLLGDHTTCAHVKKEGLESENTIGFNKILVFLEWKS